MRYVYIDEAGTTNEDPLTVVVGVVVEADASYQLLERKLAEITNTVPVKLRAGFVSHALDIWNNKRIREDWPFDQRLVPEVNDVHW